ncbi:dihydroxyacetone kinase phosphoryl donor subunit DhaM [Georgenia alba]|uniref:Phosphocarrier protein HPr n=1 Tax=Georgenia alba TaxID=2233858 RepID=A0ABW2Q746_9MICO
MAASGQVRTGLVLVSHSARLADGVVEVAAQMAPDVRIVAAGGLEDGAIGTSYALVETAISDLLGTDGLDGVVLLTDLGSATMTAESVLEALEGDSGVVLADGPLVEGAVAAAVAAQGGAGAADVARAVRDAGAAFGGAADLSAEAGDTGSGTAGAPATGDDVLTKDFVLVNEVGLHARPAATLARLVSGYDATVTVNGVDATSVLALMALGLRKGDEIHVAASGTQAAEALDGVAGSVADGFGEGAAAG